MSALARHGASARESDSPGVTMRESNTATAQARKETQGMYEKYLIEHDADGYPVAIVVTDAFGDVTESIRPCGTQVA